MRGRRGDFPERRRPEVNLCTMLQHPGCCSQVGTAATHRSRDRCGASALVRPQTHEKGIARRPGRHHAPAQAMHALTPPRCAATRSPAPLNQPRPPGRIRGNTLTVWDTCRDRLQILHTSDRPNCRRAACECKASCPAVRRCPPPARFPCGPRDGATVHQPLRGSSATAGGLGPECDRGFQGSGLDTARSHAVVIALVTVREAADIATVALGGGRGGVYVMCSRWLCISRGNMSPI